MNEQTRSAQCLYKDDWQLNSSTFRCCLGLHACYRFASHYNAQLSKFHSRLPYLVQKTSSHSTKIGVKITTGYVHLHRLHLKL